MTTPEELAEALKECSAALAEWVENHYLAVLKNYPSEMRRYARDMEPVHRARALLAALANEPRP